MAWKYPTKPLSAAEIESALKRQDTGAVASDGGPAPSANPDRSQGSPDVDTEMPYPASFADIVELIKSGKPVPGRIISTLASLGSC